MTEECSFKRCSKTPYTFLATKPHALAKTLRYFLCRDHFIMFTNKTHDKSMEEQIKWITKYTDATTAEESRAELENYLDHKDNDEMSLGDAE